MWGSCFSFCARSIPATQSLRLPPAPPPFAAHLTPHITPLSPLIVLHHSSRITHITSSLTTAFSPLISHHSSYSSLTTHLITPLISQHSHYVVSHHSSHTTHTNSSLTTHLTPVLRASRPNCYALGRRWLQEACHMPFCVAGAVHRAFRRTCCALGQGGRRTAAAWQAQYTRSLPTDLLRA